jgi:hypothetical protein
VAKGGHHGPHPGPWSLAGPLADRLIHRLAGGPRNWPAASDPIDAGVGRTATLQVLEKPSFCELGSRAIPVPDRQCQIDMPHQIGGGTVTRDSGVRDAGTAIGESYGRPSTVAKASYWLQTVQGHPRAIGCHSLRFTR